MDEGGAWDAKILYHSPVDMNATYFDGGAAVGFAGAAGDAVTTVEIGDDGDGFAGLEAFCVIEIHEIASQFMAEDAGVFEKGLGAFEGVEVGAADADATDLQHGHAGLREWRVCLAIFEMTGFCTDECFHF